MKSGTGLRQGWDPGFVVTFATAIILGVFAGTGAAQHTTGTSWFAGTWDSTIYNRAERPHAVGVRIEVVEAETDISIHDVSVVLKGHYYQEVIGPSTYPQIEPREPQRREFELSAQTGRDGVVVFALQWQKRYPWHKGRPKPEVNKRGVVKFRDVHSKWTRPVDDVEKVRVIEIRHPGFQYAEIPLDFSHLLQVGQDMSSELQEPRIFEAFERAWYQEVADPDVPFCILDLGTEFPNFQNKRCDRPEFFQKIRAKDFGTEYTRPYNWFSKGQYPQSECGPYFFYLLRIGLARRSGQLDVTMHDPRRAERLGNSGQARRSHSARSARPAPTRNEGHGNADKAGGVSRDNRAKNDDKLKHVDSPRKPAWAPQRQKNRWHSPARSNAKPSATPRGGARSDLLPKKRGRRRSNR